MKKRQQKRFSSLNGAKRACSWLLALTMAGSSLASLAPTAAAAQSGKPLAIVNAKAATGNINLSTQGKADWIHFSADESGAPILDRKTSMSASPTEKINISTYGAAAGTDWETSWFGELAASGGRFVQFVPSASGEMQNLTVSVCRGTTGSLTMAADLFQVIDGKYVLLGETKISSDEIPPWAYHNIPINFADPIYLEEGATYILRLHAVDSASDGNTLLWEVSEMGNDRYTYGRALENNTWEYQDNGKTHTFSFDVERLATSNIRTLSTRTTAVGLEDNSWVWGVNSSKGARFAQFRAENTGIMSNLKVEVGTLNSNMNLTGSFYEITEEGPVKLAETTFNTGAAEVSYGGFSDVLLDFEETIQLVKDSLYAIVLAPENEALDSNKFYWRPSVGFTSDQFTYGYIRGGEWLYENSKGNTHSFSLDVEVAPEGEGKPFDLIEGAIVGDAAFSGVQTDSSVSYTWYDGTPTAIGQSVRTAGIFTYQDGEFTGTVSEDTGYKFTIPASDTLQRMTMTAGAEQASAQVIIKADGETIYESDVLTAGEEAKTNTYSINAAGGRELEVFVKLTEKSAADGKLLIGGLTLNQIAPKTGVDYLAELSYKTPVAAAYAGLMNSAEAEVLAALVPVAESVLANNSDDAHAVFAAYYCLDEALTKLKNTMSSSNRYAYVIDGQLTGSFGWEGDKDAPIAWIDGSYELRDRSTRITFGVTDLEPGSVAWYNKDNYLPCFVSEYTKDGISYVVENFADLLVIDGNRFEIAYSRMSATNNTDKVQPLPEVSKDLVPLNEAAAKIGVVNPGETVVRDYCIGADRFGCKYAYPEDAVLQASGSWDEHYTHMKNYWEDRLVNIVDIEEIPEDYQELVYAYKAGYIYTLIIADDYELHVGENGYDRVFDHDVIGILVTLIELGHTENFREYCETILQNIQYPDAAWKFSWPFAVYLQKTGDFDTISYYWNDMADGKAGIVTNTHKIATERESYPLSEGEVIDLIENASYDQGKARELGKPGADNMRYQTFIPSVSAPLDETIVTVHAIGEPSSLVAKLYEGVGADAKEIASCTVPLETFLAFGQVPKNNGTLSEARYVHLDFGENVELKAGASYTIALGQETPSATDYYKWCKVYEIADECVSGRIHEDGTWENKNEPCTFKVSLAAETARIMKKTNAIDSYGYWTIDNYSALMGLTSYAYLCEAMYEKYGDESYKTEYDWAKAEYDSLMKAVDAVLKNTMAKYDFNYIPISMIMPTEMTDRRDPRDANWASMYEFGRWDWDGYLFGCDQNNIMHELLDDTYAHIIKSKEGHLPSPYTMGGYSGLSSAYNAGYYEAALAGEQFRTYGVEAYLWLIQNGMSCPYGTWENISGSSTTTLWNRAAATGGGGSSQHMWGQAMNTKVLLDSFLAEKADGTIIAGRGLPTTFNAEGETITISNWLADNNKRIGFTMTTEGKTITFTLTGDDLANPVSLELPALVGNIAAVSGDLSFNNATGTILIPVGTKSVTITMQRTVAEDNARKAAVDGLQTAIETGENCDASLYVSSTVRALTDAIEAGKALLTTGTTEEMKTATQAIYDAINALILLKTFEDGLDLLNGRDRVAQPTFGQQNDQRARYATFKTGAAVENLSSIGVMLEKHSAKLGDCLISIYSLEDDKFTLKDCLATGRLSPNQIVSGELNMFALDKAITLEADTYYAIHFAMDHTGDVYGEYFYYAGAFLGDDLYAVKVLENGNTVNESNYGLGTPLMLLQTLCTDKTELDAAVENAPAVLTALIEEANAVLLNPNATQEEIDAVLAKLNAANAEDQLFILDGMTGELLKGVNAEELAALDITKLASELGCLNKEGYAFAGWFTEPQAGLENWAEKSVKNVELAADNSAIYAWYIDAAYLNTTIAYTSNASRATKVFALSTAPADVFANYGFVLSTAASANDENLVIGAKIDGLNVAKIEKTTIYSWINVAPFSKDAPKTANDFNGGLGGVKDGTDGYISYALVTNMPVGKTVSARAYYTTLDGTIVYGSTAQQLLEKNASVTGVN